MASAYFNNQLFIHFFISSAIFAGNLSLQTDSSDKTFLPNTDCSAELSEARMIWCLAQVQKILTPTRIEPEPPV